MATLISTQAQNSHSITKHASVIIPCFSPDIPAYLPELSEYGLLEEKYRLVVEDWYGILAEFYSQRREFICEIGKYLLLFLILVPVVVFLALDTPESYLYSLLVFFLLQISFTMYVVYRLDVMAFAKFRELKERWRGEQWTLVPRSLRRLEIHFE